MIGSLADSREVTVVGAGFSGLLMAYMLDRKGCRVTLLEASDRSGGLIQTARTEYGIAESAAHSLLATPKVFSFFDELGIPWVPLRKEARARYILRNGRMRRFPLSVWETLGLLRRVAFAKAPLAALPGEALDQWALRHLGRPALEYVLAPFVRGVYGVQPEQLGLAAAFPSMQVQPSRTLLGTMLSKKERSPRSKMIAPRDGMADVIAKLTTHLEKKLGASFRRSARLEQIPDAPNVVLAVPAYEAAKLLVGADAKLSAALAGVAYTPIVSITVFVENVHLSKPISGVGVLVPPKEERACMGVLFNSSAFLNRSRDEQRWSSFTMMLGGTLRPEMVNASEVELRALVFGELQSLFKLKQPPAHCEIHRWQSALPQYSPHLGRTWELAKQGWCAKPGRMLFGNYTGQVSLRGMIELASTL